jgi:23S rRNA (adenine2503-C2)-methyltransferase
MGCAFCASTIGGLVRPLEIGEMLDEVLFTQAESGRRSPTSSSWASGSPGHFDNVLRFCGLVNDERGMNIGMRHISLSTCGLTERFDKLAALHLQLTLSVSRTAGRRDANQMSPSTAAGA